jgi:hypothetical protein
MGETMQRLIAKAIVISLFSVSAIFAGPAAAGAASGGGCAQEVYTRSCISLFNGVYYADAYQLSMAGYPSNTWINIYVKRCSSDAGSVSCVGCPPNYDSSCPTRAPAHSGFLRDSDYFGPYAAAHTNHSAQTIVELSYPNGPVYQWMESPIQWV